jgi:hypothetical protein
VRILEDGGDVPKVDVVLIEIRLSLSIVPLKLHGRGLSGTGSDALSFLDIRMCIHGARSGPAAESPVLIE